MKWHKIVKTVISTVGLLGLQFLFVCSVALSQTVSGVVIDAESDETLPGVNVMIKGTSTGTSTDSEGSYELDTPSQQDTLVFSFVGYQAQEVPINGQTTIDVEMSAQAVAGDELVVVGYGTQQKSDMTGSVGRVGSEALEERPASTSMNQALAGKIAGANVNVNSGRPGGRSNIRIRGNSSISNTNNPLYVIDGVILNNTGLANGSTPIDYIDPSSIESIEVLKDASATAIYGARGANGVVLVTTKGGSEEGGRVNYESYVSVGTLARKLDLLNAEEFLEVEEIAYQNAEKYDPEGSYTDPATKRDDPLLFDSNGNPLYDTDWQEEATQEAVTHNHQLSFSGGDENKTYGLYLGYKDEEGLMKQSNLTRYSGRFVIDSDINSWLTAGGSINYNVQNENQIDPLGGGGIIPMRQVVEGLPIIPVEYDDGTYGSNEDYPGMEGGTSYTDLVNNREYKLITKTTLANAYTNIDLTDNLELRSTVGVNMIDQRNDYYGGRDLNYISRSQRGVASVTNDSHTDWQVENYLTYSKDFNDNHSLTALLGASWQHVSQFVTTAENQGFLDDYFKYNNLGVGDNPQSPTSSKSAYGLNSYFTRINYNLHEKYLFTATGRVDGSSKFGERNKYAFFPSGAIGWRLSEEEFLQQVSFISDLKLRTSYGMTGNSEISSYQGLAGLGNYSAVFGGERTIGVGISRLANPNLQWEKNEQVDVGLEVGLFDNRFQFEMDIYRRVSNNMLLNAPVPATSGYTSVSRNVGSMENRGLEFVLSTANISRENFSWTTDFNISFNKNEVLELTGGADIINAGTAFATIIREGESVNSFYGYNHLGTWDTDEAEEAAQYNRLPGDVKYEDINDDGRINDEDRVILGKGTPDGYGSFINNISYKNFEVLLDLQFMYGNDVMYGTFHSAEDRVGIANSLESVLNAWTPDNQDTPIAQLRPTSAGYDTNPDSHKVHDASFIRGRNLMVAYNFSPENLENLHLNRLRLYASMQNFFVITKYPYYDPEVSTSGNQFAQGIALYDYPKPRVLMLGLNIGF